MFPPWVKGQPKGKSPCLVISKGLIYTCLSHLMSRSFRESVNEKSDNDKKVRDIQNLFPVTLTRLEI